jgi:hypothetical protein
VGGKKLLEYPLLVSFAVSIFFWSFHFFFISSLSAFHLSSYFLSSLLCL